MTLAASVSQATMTTYFEGLGKLLGRVERRASFALYAAGLLSALERKSVEPIAALASEGDPKRCALLHDRLLHLLNTSPWSDDDVRAYAADYALRALTEDEPVEARSLDDTGFLKQGHDPVGVQRQYTGKAGKVTNGQVAVSLTVATRSAHLPVDMARYLPAGWADDEARREAAQVPASVRFQTKHDLALDLLAKALLAGAAARLLARRQRLRLERTLPRRARGGLFPPRRPGRVTPVRSSARPERHFTDSFITLRLAIARLARAWLEPSLRPVAVGLAPAPRAFVTRPDVPQ